jgi:hypothetical protein
VKRYVALLCTALLWDGCALPIHYSVADKAPFDAVVGKVVITTQITYLNRLEIFHPPKEARPNLQYRYYLGDMTWREPSFTLPPHTKLRVTGARRMTALPGIPMTMNIGASNQLSATIGSGPFVGVKVFMESRADPDELPRFISVR